MNKIIALVIWVSIISYGYSQKLTETTENISSGQVVEMDFTWPELITIRTWDKNEVKVVSKALINNGQNDDAFQIEVKKTSTGLNIASDIPTMDKLPQCIMIKKDGQKYFFNTDDRNSKEIKAFKEEHPGGYEYLNIGVITEIEVEIWVPNTVKLDVYSKFGLIEVKGFEGDMNIHSKFGGVDVSAGTKGVLKAGTQFGSKYTNLEKDMKTISIGDHPGKWDWISFSLNGGAVKQEVKSDFGNVYIRQL